MARNVFKIAACAFVTRLVNLKFPKYQYVKLLCESIEKDGSRTRTCDLGVTISFVKLQFRLTSKPDYLRALPTELSHPYSRQG